MFSTSRGIDRNADANILVGWCSALRIYSSAYERIGFGVVHRRATTSNLIRCNANVVHLSRRGSHCDPATFGESEVHNVFRVHENDITCGLIPIPIVLFVHDRIELSLGANRHQAQLSMTEI